MAQLCCIFPGNDVGATSDRQATATHLQHALLLQAIHDLGGSQVVDAPQALQGAQRHRRAGRQHAQQGGEGPQRGRQLVFQVCETIAASG